MNAHLVALATVLVWGTTFVSTKVLLVDFAPVEILFARFLMAFAALCVLRPRMLRLQRRRHEVLFAAAGFTGIMLYYLLENVALVYTDASKVGVIVTVAPLFTALIAVALRAERAPKPLFYVGFVLAMAGVVLVSFPDPAALVGAGSAGSVAASGGAASDAGSPGILGLGINLGDVLALAAALVWAVYSTVIARIAALGYETIAVTKRTFAWGLAFMLPVLALSQPSLDVARFASAVNIGNLLFLGLIASAACFAMWGYAVSRLGAARTSVYIYLTPAITVTASVLVLGETLTPQIVLGIVLVVGGLVLSARS